MKMVELKATLAGGTRVELSTGTTGPMITLRKSSGDQRESADHFYCGMEEWDEIRIAVRELLSMVGQVDADPPPPGSVRHG